MLIRIVCWRQRLSLVNNKQYNLISLSNTVPFIDHFQNPVYILIITKHQQPPWHGFHFAAVHAPNIRHSILVDLEDRPRPLHELHTAPFVPLACALVYDDCYHMLLIAVLVPNSVLLFARFEIDALGFRYNLYLPRHK